MALLSQDGNALCDESEQAQTLRRVWAPGISTVDARSRRCCKMQNSKRCRVLRFKCRVRTTAARSMLQGSRNRYAVDAPELRGGANPRCARDQPPSAVQSQDDVSSQAPHTSSAFTLRAVGPSPGLAPRAAAPKKIIPCLSPSALRTAVAPGKKLFFRPPRSELANRRPFRPWRFQ